MEARERVELALNHQEADRVPIDYWATSEITEKLIAQSCITPGIHRVFSNLLAAHAETGQIFMVDAANQPSGSSAEVRSRNEPERRARTSAS